MSMFKKLGYALNPVFSGFPPNITVFGQFLEIWNEDGLTPEPDDLG